MPTEAYLLLIAAVVALGVGAQWLAWRFRLPSILLLLLVGFVVGPVTGLIPPELLRGTWIFPFVSLAVGIILFEGGLSLRVRELREVGRTVRNLITVGVGVTFGLATLAAHSLVGFGWNVALVLGALLTVTGPTVVLPLLRLVRPQGRAGTIAKWEGITVDPVGAILAVLVLEAVLLVNEPAAEGAAQRGGFSAVLPYLAGGLLRTAVVGVGVAVGGASLLLLLLRRRLVPEWLENPLVLATVVSAFALANRLQHEAGLLVTVLMGIILANQRRVPVRRIAEFKEDLRVLLLPLLFIVLSARLDPAALAYAASPGPLLFLAALIVVVRPAAVAFASLGTGLSWREQAFLAWMAPRGVVAAAVASLFSFRLAPLYPAEAAALVPLVFLVIVGTVAIYGLTITPLARALGLAKPDPQGVAFVGAHPWARRIASALQAQGLPVLLLDTNPENVRAAEAEGLPAHRANVLAEEIADDLNLEGIGRLIALTSNDEVNVLATLHFTEVLGRAAVFQLPARPVPGAGPREGMIPAHLRGEPLFAPDATFSAIEERFERGADVAALPLTPDRPWATVVAEHGDVLPLFLVRGGRLHVFRADRADVVPQPGDTVFALVGAPA
jgi:NhaP-type Na+/H+ or K+/H+ antiporter